MANKFHHVRHAKLDPTVSHTCHWPGCAVQIPKAMAMCRSHWESLPKLIRARVWDAYEVGQEDHPELVSQQYLDAMSAARAWAERYQNTLKMAGPESFRPSPRR